MASLCLTIVGVYGIVITNVTERTREMGIRMAVGADPGQVMRYVLGRGLRLTAWGAARRSHQPGDRDSDRLRRADAVGAPRRADGRPLERIRGSEHAESAQQDDRHVAGITTLTTGSTGAIEAERLGRGHTESTRGEVTVGPTAAESEDMMRRP